MAGGVDHNQNQNQQTQQLPPVLVLGPPLIIQLLESLYSHKYHFLKAWASPLPPHQFLNTHHVDPSSVRVILWSPHQRVTADVLRFLPSVGLIVTTSVGTDHIDLPECHRRGIEVTNIAGGLFSEDVADMAVGLLIDVWRKISATDRYVRKLVQFEPSNFPLGSKVGGKRIGIVGLGSIGKEVAKRLDAFGCRIMYHSRNQKSFVSYPFYSNVVELAVNSDALVLCCALTEQTYHIVNREVMLAMGKGGVIVNVGRGALINEKELVHCLMEGEIAGAGLDVFENEPNVPKELFALDSVVLSPHAGALTSESFTDVCEHVARNLEAFFSSIPLITPLMVD